MSFKQENNLDYFLTNVGKLYETGVNLYANKIYPQVSYPVPRGTPMISPLVQWDHNQNWAVMTPEDVMTNGGKGVSCSFVIDPYSAESKVLLFKL